MSTARAVAQQQGQQQQGQQQQGQQQQKQQSPGTDAIPTRSLYTADDISRVIRKASIEKAIDLTFWW
jgi:hypothetical protein